MVIIFPKFSTNNPSIFRAKQNAESNSSLTELIYALPIYYHYNFQILKTTSNRYVSNIIAESESTQCIRHGYKFFSLVQ